MANSDLIASLVKGSEIVKLVGFSDNGIKSSEIMTAMNLKAPTCYSLLRTLVACGFLEKRNGRFYLGNELILLTKKQSNSSFLAKVETELMALYQKLSRGTVIFAVPGLDGILQTHRISFDRPGVIQHLDSEPMHPYASAAGLVYLAFLTDEMTVLRVNERWPFADFGSHLWKSREALNKYLDQVRKTQIAVSPFEKDVYLRISAPVLDQTGKLIAAAGASIPAQLMKNKNMETIQKEVSHSAAMIAAALA
ncbi:MAG: helix-turn-helix domain-containing protein [Lentisphaerae bacterium]|nr:helix-turn-helix domain-containing protein [Lentisphaerota bacterium]